jgi:hypothetical protein
MVNTKYLMIASAAVMGMTGLSLLFFPSVILSQSGYACSSSTELFLQLGGGVYFGFAMLNWMSKGAMIGGIYARPVSLGNFSHFVIGALTLGKFALKNTANGYSWIVTFIYFAFAILFGVLVFTSAKRG